MAERTPVERPMLFKGPLVKAILEDRKTQTRRLIKTMLGWSTFNCQQVARTFQPSTTRGYDWTFKANGCWQDLKLPELLERCPYGRVGDRIWVRETTFIAPPNFGHDDDTTHTDDEGRRRVVTYKASMDADSIRCANDYGVKQTNSIHMPRWACRLVLEITEVRVQRLQEITEEEARLEGIRKQTVPANSPYWFGGYHRRQGAPFCTVHNDARTAFADLWNSIEGEDAWDKNPYVWSISFKKVTT